MSVFRIHVPTIVTHLWNSTQAVVKRNGDCDVNEVRAWQVAATRSEKILSSRGECVIFSAVSQFGGVFVGMKI